MKHSKMWTPLVLGTCLLAAVSCGSDDDDSGSGAQAPQPEQEEQQQDQGEYVINFTPLNSGVGGNAAAGTGTIRVTDRTASIRLNMTGVPARMTHLQNITSAGACPSTTADTNGDGFIDVVEGVPSYGQILIPLDGNINTQASGSVQAPRADASGAYTYNRSATLTRLLEDLQAEDADPTDAITKLPEGENLNLDGRTVIIHGVPDSANLPETVATLPGVNAEQTLPIACGTITRVSTDTTTGGTGTGTTTGGTGTTTGGTGTTTGGTGTTTGGTGTTTGGTGTTTGGTGTTTGGTGTTTGGTGTTTGGTGTTTGGTGTTTGGTGTTTGGTGTTTGGTTGSSGTTTTG